MREAYHGAGARVPILAALSSRVESWRLRLPLPRPPRPGRTSRAGRSDVMSPLFNRGGDADALATRIGEHARRLSSPRDLDPLIERIGDARYVLIGEASHGTSEFYEWRAELS